MGLRTCIAVAIVMLMATSIGAAPDAASIIKDLESKDGPRRLAALLELRDFGGNVDRFIREEKQWKSLWKALVTSSKDTDPDIKMWSCVSIVKFGTIGDTKSCSKRIGISEGELKKGLVDTVDVIIEGCRRKQEQDRNYCISSIESMGRALNGFDKKSDYVFQELLAMAKDKTSGARWRALQILVSYQGADKHVQDIFEMAKEEDANEARKVLAKSKIIGKKKLFDILKDKSLKESIRRSASSVLAEEDDLSPIPVDEAWSLFKSEKDFAMYSSVSNVICKMGKLAKSIVPEMITEMESSSDYRKTTLILCIGRIAEEPSKSIPALVKLIGDSDKSVRSSAVTSISMFGKAAETALPDLSARLKSETDDDVRYSIQEAMKKIRRS